jgi:hypothetical protein
MHNLRKIIEVTLVSRMYIQCFKPFYMKVGPFVSPFATLEVLYSYLQPVVHLGRGISPSQGRYLHTTTTTTNNNSLALVRERTIATERPPLVGEVSANFSG